MRILLALAVGLAVVTWPRLSRACSCFASAALLTPDDGDLAADEALLFSVFCGTPEETVALTVDGVEASWNIDARMSATGIVAIRLVDALDPGQELRVFTCSEFDCTDPMNFQEEATFIVTEPAGRDPDPPINVVLTHQEGNFELGCLEQANLQFNLDVALPDFSPAVYRVDLTADGAERTISRVHVADDDAESFAMDFNLVRENLGADPGAFCATVTAYDLSGRSAPPVEACDSTAGCGCQSGSHPPGALLLLVVPALGWPRRGRKARSWNSSGPAVSKES